MYDHNGHAKHLQSLPLQQVLASRYDSRWQQNWEAAQLCEAQDHAGAGVPAGKRAGDRGQFMLSVFNHPVGKSELSVVPMCAKSFAVPFSGKGGATHRTWAGCTLETRKVMFKLKDLFLRIHSRPTVFFRAMTKNLQLNCDFIIRKLPFVDAQPCSDQARAARSGRMQSGMRAAAESVAACAESQC